MAAATEKNTDASWMAMSGECRRRGRLSQLLRANRAWVRTANPGWPRVERLDAQVRAILGTPEVRERLLAAGLEPSPSTPEELEEIIRSDIAKWAKVIKAANIKSSS